MTEKFRFLDHTADYAMEAYGNSLGEVLENAARGMFYLIMEEPPQGDPKTKQLDFPTEPPDSLLFNWLRELLFLYETERFVPESFQIEIEQGQFRGLVDGTVIPEDVILPQIVKAVTYHNLTVKQDSTGQWRAHVVFDT